MFGVALPVPPSWHRIETLRPDRNPWQDFGPVGFVAGGRDLVRHVSSKPPISNASSSEGLVVIGSIAKAHSTPCDGQYLCGQMEGAMCESRGLQDRRGQKDAEIRGCACVANM